MARVKIEFATQKAAGHFLTWLCEQGEQDYWTWQECREEEEAGDITAVNFNYDFKALTATTELGRVTKEEDHGKTSTEQRIQTLAFWVLCFILSALAAQMCNLVNL